MQNSSIAQVVRTRRKQLRLSQEKLGLISGTGRPFISDVERGKETLRMDKLSDVLRAMGMEIRVVECDR